MSVDDMVKDFVLQLLRRGYKPGRVAEALAAQKIALMQTDEYLEAMNHKGGEDDGVRT